MVVVVVWLSGGGGGGKGVGARVGLGVTLARCCRSGVAGLVIMHVGTSGASSVSSARMTKEEKARHTPAIVADPIAERSSVSFGRTWGPSQRRRRSRP